MDEPTAGVGVEETDRILELTKEIKQKGISVVLITHHLEHIFEVADRVMVLRSGRYIGERRTQEINRKSLVYMMMGAHDEQVSS